MKQQFSVSVHVDRAEAALAAEAQSRWVRVPPQADWSAAMREVTMRTAAPLASVLVGLHTVTGIKHRQQRSQYDHYTALAHRRGTDGRLIDPQLPSDRLYQPGTVQPLPDIAQRFVRAEVTELTPGTHRADDHLYFDITRRGYERGKLFIAQAMANPWPYNIQNPNCASFARDFLKATGVTIPFPADMSIGARRLQRPAHFSELAERLAQGAEQPGLRVLTATPLLLG